MVLLCFPKRSANRVIPFLLMMMMMATRTTPIEAFSFADLFCRHNPCTGGISSTKGRSAVDDWILRCKITINDEINNDTTMVSSFENDNSTEFVYLLQNEVNAWHMGGSSNQKAERRNKNGRAIQKFKNHKAQWMKETCCEWPSKCSTKDCSNVPIVGAHVVIDGKENVHLVPMCQSCNLDLSKNWLPDKEERNGIQPNNDAFELRKGTNSIELSHISKYQSMIAMDVISWDDMYDRLVLHVGKYNTTSISREFPDNKLTEWVSRQRLRYKAQTIPSNEICLLEDIGFSWDPVGDSWNNNFALLEQYKLNNGDCNVPQRYEETGQNLGWWLGMQRQNRKNNRLDTEKEKQLEDLGVIWEPSNDNWEENFKLLQQYKHRNGNCNVPHRYEVNGGKLGIWLDTQRTDKRNNRLDDTKEKRLDALGVIWEPQLNQWEEKYELLEQFKTEKGHCNVPRGQKVDRKYRALGQWLSAQRVYYRKGNLETERQTKLDKLGVEWNLKRNRKELIDQWEENFKLIQQYKHTTGNCNVPQQYEDHGVNLGDWLSKQRQNRKNNRLDTEKEKQLEDLGVIWEPFIDQWEENFKLLEQFKNEKGHCNVSTSQKKNEKYRVLGKWLSNQRTYYRTGKLSKERRLKLVKLGVLWKHPRNVK